MLRNTALKGLNVNYFSNQFKQWCGRASDENTYNVLQDWQRGSRSLLELECWDWNKYNYSLSLLLDEN